MCSNEYFTKNATPRKSARPPIQAKSFAPMNCSQLIAGIACLGGADRVGGGAMAAGACLGGGVDADASAGSGFGVGSGGGGSCRGAFEGGGCANGSSCTHDGRGGRSGAGESAGAGGAGAGVAGSETFAGGGSRVASESGARLRSSRISRSRALTRAARFCATSRALPARMKAAMARIGRASSARTARRARPSMLCQRFGSGGGSPTCARRVHSGS